jgi:glycosyltransferase involved in cell wall biosynthesis
MGIKLLDVELKAHDPLDLYRLKDKFPVRAVPTPVHQDSSNLWWATNRLWVHFAQALKETRSASTDSQLVFYTKNYGPAFLFHLLKVVSKASLMTVFEAHVLPSNIVKRYVLRKADAVVANSLALRNDLVAQGVVRPDSVLGVHQGVDLEAYNALRTSKQEARQKTGLPLQKRLAVYTGKVYWGYKEVEYLLVAARLLCESDIHFVVVGGREDHVERLRAYAAKKEIRNITFTGFVPPTDVPYYQMAADVLLLYYPSGIDLNDYRSPGKLFEYMASRRPIIAADYPVLHEVLHEDMAVFVPPDAPQLLAQAIVDVLNEDDKIEALTQQAAKGVGLFTWEARAKQIIEFINSISQNKQRQRAEGDFMKKSLKLIVKPLLRRHGYDIVQYRGDFPVDFSNDEVRLIRSVQPYTMTSPERIYALIRAVAYLVNRNIPGSIVECGVWKGGSVMAVAKTLLQLNTLDRDLYLFDTFEGMPEPSNVDVSWYGGRASKKFNITKTSDESSNWCYAPLDEVRSLVYGTGYDKEKIHFIKGKVEDTIPENAPAVISLLRLDTDWYESTRHELVHLFPRLSRGGVIIIDDYGHWKGVRKAVDEYFSQNNISLLLNRIDYASRIGVKL